MKLLSPKLDIVFKQLFVTDTEILLNLVNAVLSLSERRKICHIEVKNPLILPEEIVKKFIILDIYAVDESGGGYDIEMQVRHHTAYQERSLYYLSRMYGGQLESGNHYEKLKPAVGIHFLDYELFSGYRDWHHCFEMRDRNHPELRLTEDFAIFIFELRKAADVLNSAEKHSNILEWLSFFNHAPEEKDKTMRTHYKNPAVHKAFDALEQLSADEKARHLAEVREKALKDENSFLYAARQEGIEEGKKAGIEEGKKAGIEEGKKETAKNLLSLGVLTVEQIAEATGLSAEEIEKLKTV